MIRPTMFSAPMVMDSKVITAAIANTTNQIKTLHFITLVPSNVAKGNRLNAAKQLFTEYPTVQIKYIKEQFDLPDSACYLSWEDILAQPKMADAAIICTQDRMHFEPAMKAISLGYNLLLEKPVSQTPEECARIALAAKEKGVSTVTAGGGVAANGYLRERLQKACKKANLRLVLPEKRYCTDNAAMIASEGLIQYRLGNFADMTLTAKASIPLAATLETVQSKRAAQNKE